MIASKFSPLIYSNRLKSAGMETKQADMLALLQEEIIEGIDITVLATKKDILDMRDEMSHMESKLIIIANDGTWRIIKIITSLVTLQIALQTLINFFPK